MANIRFMEDPYSQVRMHIIRTACETSNKTVAVFIEQQS